MGSSTNNHPPVFNEAFQQYLDQKLTDQARVFQSQMDALTEQFRRFTATNAPVIPPPPPDPPNLPHYSPQRHVPHRFQQRQAPIPRQGLAFAHGPHHGQPRVPLRHHPVPPATHDPVPYRDDLPTYGMDEYDDNWEDEFPIHVVGHHRDPIPNRWASRFRHEIPEFHGNHNATEFLDWLTAIEQVFHSAGVPSPDRVGLAVTKFRGSALAWWRALSVRRAQVDEPMVETWEELRREMKTAFLPYRYKQQLFAKLCNFRQGNLTVKQYTESFYTLLARNEVAESHDKLVARYLSGLTPTLQDKLTGFYFQMVEQIIPQAEAF